MKTLTVLTFLTLGACTQYHYVKPETEQGRQCVAALDAKVNACERRAEDMAQSQRAVYDAQMVSYRACAQQATASAQMPDPCAGAKPIDSREAQRNTCRTNYDKQFIECGGRLEEIQ